MQRYAAGGNLAGKGLAKGHDRSYHEKKKAAWKSAPPFVSRYFARLVRLAAQEGGNFELLIALMIREKIITRIVRLALLLGRTLRHYLGGCTRRRLSRTRCGRLHAHILLCLLASEQAEDAA